MRSTLPALLLGAVLLTSGCLGFLASPPPPSDQRAMDAVNRSQAAVADVSSYRFVLDGHAEARKGDEHVRVDVGGDGVVDVAGKRLNATTRTDDAARATYIDGYTLYTECARVGWGRENLSRSNDWPAYTPVGHQLALLEQTNVYWRGTETVDGTEAAVVVAHPTKADLEAVADQNGVAVTDFTDANVKNVTATLVLDTDTWRPIRASIDVTITERGATATAEMTFRYSDYDEPTTVTRPPDMPTGDDFWSHGCPGS